MAAKSSLDSSAFIQMIDFVVAKYPQIKVLATTLREVHSTNRHQWSAVAWIGGKAYVSPACHLDVYDRVGGGDGFAAGLFYGLLTDLLEITSKVKDPVLRNAPLAKELESLCKTVDSAWVLRAIAGFDELYLGARRNLNRQLGLDVLAASLAPALSRTSEPRP